MPRRRLSRLPRWLSGLLASVALVAVVSGVIALLEPHVPVLSLLVLYLLAVLPVAVFWGARFAALTSVVSIVAFALQFLPSRESVRVADPRNLAALGVFLVTAVLVGELAARSRRAAVQAGRLSVEQSALRRVATLVARSEAPAVVFEAVTREVGLLSGADLARMERYEADGSVTGVASWGTVPDRLAVGTRFDLDGLSVARDVLRTAGPVRLASFAGATGAIAQEARALGIFSSVGCPIVVAGRLWGVIAASTTSEKPFPANTESQIASFTELVATAVENADARAELRRMAEEQAALRRGATRVARGEPPAAVFAALAEDVGRLFTAASAAVVRYETDRTVTVVGSWSSPGDGVHVAVGPRAAVGGDNVVTRVLETGRPARMDRYPAGDSGALSAEAGAAGVRSSVGAPISVEGRVWGALVLGSPREAGLAGGLEQRVADFADLAAIAVANAQAREQLRAIVDEQAALRRVATLVARGGAPDRVFAAVAQEVGTLFGADASALVRFEPDGQATFLGGSGWRVPPRPGSRFTPPPGYPLAAVRATGRATRTSDGEPASGELPEVAEGEGVRCAVDAPIAVEGRLWGAINIASRRGRLPADTEQRIADFTELVATAIANAEAHTKLTQSRARIVATADATRRQIERDLHDGAQQRLVSLALELRLAQGSVPADRQELRAALGRVADGLTAVLDELREISRGIHPAILSEGGLGPAMRMLARRSAVPVELTVATDSRYPTSAEVAAYYVVSEALTNTPTPPTHRWSSKNATTPCTCA
ncbi:MAG TPA: GAF domain-containing protein [Actinoplanes sp.]|nr:GAF domain-containing protein [Actinoplanes sp.]